MMKIVKFFSLIISFFAISSFASEGRVGFSDAQGGFNYAELPEHGDTNKNNNKQISLETQVIHQGEKQYISQVNSKFNAKQQASTGFVVVNDKGDFERVALSWNSTIEQVDGNTVIRLDNIKLQNCQDYSINNYQVQCQSSSWTKNFNQQTINISANQTQTVQLDNHTALQLSLNN